VGDVRLTTVVDGRRIFLREIICISGQLLRQSSVAPTSLGKRASIVSKGVSKNTGRKASPRCRAALLLNLLGCVSGGAAVSFAAASPVVMGAFGIAADYAVYTMKKSRLQAAADAAALAATRELSVIGSGGSGSGSGSASAKTASAAMAGAASTGGGPIEDIARSYVQSALPKDSSTTSTGVSIDDAAGSVQVTVTDNWKPFFAHFLGADITPIVAHARAELVGESKVCVIATIANGAGGVSVTKNAHLEGNGCSIYSNSTNSAGFYLGNGSSVKADLVCSAGGVFNSGAMTGTQVLTDCPPLPDPLASRAPPSFGACDYTNTKISSGAVTLNPGVYCGGITISKTAKVTFAPGNYIIKNGLFLVMDTASVTGKNVAFYLTGSASLLQFFGDATIDLSGAEEGEMAGLLFFEDPSTSGLLRIHNIRSSRAYNLTGTIYLPKGNLLVDPTAPVGEKSAYTAIIAKRLIVDNGPSLVLNTNYGATKVPVPDGIRSAAEVVLAN
jgi:Flp pilus assembly protein TadG